MTRTRGRGHQSSGGVTTSRGPLALVCNGDRIRLDVPNRTVDLLVDDEELDIRRTRPGAAPPA
ncbi:dihydroxy-acid dehydratase [Nocardia sp. NPDC050412]|uniref:dihydroxy-acid dehydratase domain-containing protein n=1 Tax=Nocardia TaxID=1817 RepID=UPI00379668E5